MRDEELVVVLLLSSFTLFATTIGFAIAWIRARERALRAEGRAGLFNNTAPGADRLERAVDAIALEVERISEGQRFVTRLLAESPSQTRQAGRNEPPRLITPH